MDTLFLSPGIPTTSPAERTALVDLAAALLLADPEVCLVFYGGMTQNEEQLMSGEATVRATKGRFWLSLNGRHIGDWDLTQVAELERFMRSCGANRIEG